MRLHLFNPETEYALASGNASYTPPKNVAEMAARLSRFPVLYADKGDAVILRDENFENPLNHLLEEFARSRNIRFIPSCSLRNLYRSQKGIDVMPWGWNRNLRKWLFEKGIPDDSLPSEERMAGLRGLAHRRTTIKFHHNYGSLDIFHPKEFFSAEQALDFIDRHGNVCFKAPWSSSGRGVFFTEGFNRSNVEQRIRGVIRNQGSIMAEYAFSRILDFGSEWDYLEGKADFKGFSPLFVSEKGKYIYNLIVTNDEFLNDVLPRYLSGSYEKDFDLHGIIERQKEALQETIDNEYEGPIGIDMFITSDYDINPCVEINFRRTMGRVALDIAEKSKEDSLYDSFIKSIFPGKKLDLSRLIK